MIMCAETPKNNDIQPSCKNINEMKWGVTDFDNSTH